MTVAMFLLCFCVITFFCWLLQHWLLNRRFYRLLGKIPQVEGNLPLVGHVHKFLGADSKLLFKVIKQITENGPSPRKLWVAVYPYVLIDDPDQLQKILSSKHCTDKVKQFYNKFIIDNG